MIRIIHFHARDDLSEIAVPDTARLWFVKEEWLPSYGFHYLAANHCTPSPPAIFLQTNAVSTSHATLHLRNLMKRFFDHIDLRVLDLEKACRFYEQLLPALGFTKNSSSGPWRSWQAEESREFFGLIESATQQVNENRIAFWAESTGEVDRLSELVRQAGALYIEGPGYDEGPGYYAVFFEDPSGNRLEICHREPSAL